MIFTSIDNSIKGLGGAASPENSNVLQNIVGVSHTSTSKKQQYMSRRVVSKQPKIPNQQPLLLNEPVLGNVSSRANQASLRQGAYAPISQPVRAQVKESNEFITQLRQASKVFPALVDQKGSGVYNYSKLMQERKPSANSVALNKASALSGTELFQATDHLSSLIAAQVSNNNSSLIPGNQILAYNGSLIVSNGKSNSNFGQRKLMDPNMLSEADKKAQNLIQQETYRQLEMAISQNESDEEQEEQRQLLTPQQMKKRSAVLIVGDAYELGTKIQNPFSAQNDGALLVDDEDELNLRSNPSRTLDQRLKNSQQQHNSSMIVQSTSSMTQVNVRKEEGRGQSIKAMAYRVMNQGDKSGGSKTTSSMHNKDSSHQPHHRNRPDVINNIYNPNGLGLSYQQPSLVSLGKKERKRKSKKHQNGNNQSIPTLVKLQEQYQDHLRTSKDHTNAITRNSYKTAGGLGIQKPLMEDGNQVQLMQITNKHIPMRQSQFYNPSAVHQNNLHSPNITSHTSSTVNQQPGNGIQINIISNINIHCNSNGGGGLQDHKHCDIMENAKSLNERLKFQQDQLRQSYMELHSQMEHQKSISSHLLRDRPMQITSSISKTDNPCLTPQTNKESTLTNKTDVRRATQVIAPSNHQIPQKLKSWHVQKAISGNRYTNARPTQPYENIQLNCDSPQKEPLSSRTANASNSSCVKVDIKRHLESTQKKKSMNQEQKVLEMMQNSSTLIPRVSAGISMQSQNEIAKNQLRQLKGGVAGMQTQTFSGQRGITQQSSNQLSHMKHTASSFLK